jgi:hypothetical protein
MEFGLAQGEVVQTVGGGGAAQLKILNPGAGVRNVALVSKLVKLQIHTIVLLLLISSTPWSLNTVKMNLGGPAVKRKFSTLIIVR